MNWIKFDDARPSKKDGEFKVILQDGTITNAHIDENWQRTTLMVQGADGAFWRPLTNYPTHWSRNEV